MVTVASQRYVGPLILMNTMMVRTKVFVGNRVSDESIRTFFFGVTHDLPVVSLAVDASNFEFKNGCLFGMGTNVLSSTGAVLQNYPFSGSNAWQDRETEVAIEFFESQTYSTSPTAITTFVGHLPHGLVRFNLGL